MDNFVVVPVNKLTDLPTDLLLEIGFAFFEGDDIVLDLCEVHTVPDPYAVRIPFDSIFDAGLDLEEVEDYPIYQREVNLPPSCRQPPSVEIL